MTTKFLEGFLTFIAIVAIMTSSCISCSNQPNIRNLLQLNDFKIYESVTQVISLKGPKYEDHGILATAWAFDKDHLITAGHFCNGLETLIESEQALPQVRVKVSDNKGDPWEVGLATIVAYKNEHNFREDVCVLKLENHGLPPLVVARDLSSILPEDSVSFTGAPQGIFPLKRTGFIIQTRSKIKVFEGTMLVSMDVQGGASGAPLMWNGQVIGIIIATTANKHDGDTLHNGGIVARMDDILPFIEANLD